MNMPPRWGFWSFGVGGYKDVAPLELKAAVRLPFGQPLNSMAVPRRESEAEPTSYSIDTGKMCVQSHQSRCGAGDGLLFTT
jgi:hypothetical protein